MLNAFELLILNILLLLSTNVIVFFLCISAVIFLTAQFLLDFEVRNSSHRLVRGASSLQRGCFSATSYNLFANDHKELQYTLRNKHKTWCTFAENKIGGIQENPMHETLLSIVQSKGWGFAVEVWHLVVLGSNGIPLQKETRWPQTELTHQLVLN